MMKKSSALFSLPLCILTTSDAVPKRYRGIWQRSLLETALLRDTDTTVFWLQSAYWHADIRIPPGMPDFSNVRALADCDPVQLAWLARQQGFAGRTELSITETAEVCQWHRRLDFHPSTGIADIGDMQFEAELLLETGLDGAYLEHWNRLPDSSDGFAVLQLLAPDDHSAAPAQVLFIAGDYVMHVKGRSIDWPEASTHAARLALLAASKALLDFEISFGRRTLNGWTTLHSTLPWLIGSTVTLGFGPRLGKEMTLTIDTVAQNWKILEWDFA